MQGLFIKKITGFRARYNGGGRTSRHVTAPGRERARARACARPVPNLNPILILILIPIPIPIPIPTR